MTKENTMRLLLLSWLLVSGWVQADEAAVEAMQEYLMFSEYEAGIILPNQIDQTVFETATFIDTQMQISLMRRTSQQQSILSGVKCWIESTKFQSPV